MRFIKLVFVFSILVLGGREISRVHAQSKVSEKTAGKVTDQDLQIRESMIKMSRQLGVTCNHCHDVSNFKSDKMSAFKISKHHMKLVDILNVQGLGGVKTGKVDCYMCHRGKAVPDFKEPLD